MTGPSAAYVPLEVQTSWAGVQAAPYIRYTLATWKPYRPFWNYEDGCIYKGALDLYAATGLRSFFDFVYREVSARVAFDGAIRGFDPGEFNIDNINAGKTLFTLFEVTKEERFRKAIDVQAAQLARHPRTASGNYWHKKIYPNQVWLDGLYMAQPFQVALSQLKGDASLARDTAQQFAHVRSALRDGKTGLYRHGWDESGAQRWADPATKQSAHAWGRAMGWFAMALVDCLEMADAFEAGDRETMTALLRDVAAGLFAARSAGGLWQQVLDAREREGNYEEASATLMITYALMKGARIGVLGADARAIGFDAFVRATERFLTATELGGICGVAGLGGTPYRDGSYAYYLSEPVVANDPKGVGAWLMALAEGIRARQFAA
ncbi:MAG: glycoside hydrolase family 88 protein [Alphaproteobacteria bacterium]|nr:glycoside hydrolase family 88 protein [Alphaproteobacteria bacterium]